MSYKVKSEIVGFPNISEVNITEIDELFSTMADTENENISFTIANPYLLREYSFDIPTSTKVLLDIKESSKLSVHNILVIQKPLENSTVNFLAPIIINHDNNTLAQCILDPNKNRDFGMAETIASFKKK